MGISTKFNIKGKGKNVLSETTLFEYFKNKWNLNDITPNQPLISVIDKTRKKEDES